MAIYLHCPECKSSVKVKSKICKCGHEFGRSKKYRVVRSVGGKRLSKMCPNLSIARDLDTKWAGQVLKGDYDLKKQSIPTFGTIWKQYLKVKASKKSLVTDKHLYDKHLKHWERKPINGITGFTVSNLVRQYLDGKKTYHKGKLYSKATVRHIFKLIHRIYAATGNNQHNPCLSIDGAVKNKISGNKGRIVRLSADEVKDLNTVLESHPVKDEADFVKFMLNTGCRRGELFKLQWKDVYLADRRMTLKDPKGGVDVDILLTDKACEILKSRQGKGYVFGTDKQWVSFRGPWTRIKKAAGIDSKFPLHGLRHTFASILVDNGVDIYVIKEMLGHKDVRTTEIYLHMDDAPKREALKVINEMM